jgi:phosphoadenosine phosphosulfate reductase
MLARSTVEYHAAGAGGRAVPPPPPAGKLAALRPPAPLEQVLDERVAELHRRLDDYIAADKSVCTSSSFQTHSIPLLHMLSTWRKDIPVYFLDTGYHFPETLRFRDDVVALLDLDLRILESVVPKIAQRNARGDLLFTTDPDECCWLNKVDPMDRALVGHDVWVSGVRADQTSVRAAMQMEIMRADGVLRYNPLLSWSQTIIDAYRDRYRLPPHPLDPRGELSIGCAPCTRLTSERDGRWIGLAKTECGLHIARVG